MVDLRFFCFGNFELFVETESLPKPATLKAQSLLAYLLRHQQRPSPREHLMTLFWGERPSHRARRSLSTALWHIRRCLPHDELIQADNQTVQWQGAFWLDVSTFEQLAGSSELRDLETAVSLYRGDFLEGFYDEWIIDERYHLHGRFLELLSHLITLYEANAHHQQALTTALRLLAQDALQESAHRAAMRGYAHLGQRNAALEQFHQCRIVVHTELGVEPMPETQALYEQIRDGRFLPLSPPLSPLPSALPPTAPKPPRSTPPFVGRENELAFLHQQWQTKEHSLLLIGGEAGIGKTRLLYEFTQQFQNSPLPTPHSPHYTLHGRCYEFERLLPYQPFAEALSPLVATFAANDWGQLPAWVFTELTRLLPDLLDILPGQQLTDLLPDRTRLFSAIGHLLTALAAQRPLLLILEDLHWATESTLQLLHYLTRQVANQPIILIGTFRQEQVGGEHPLTALQRQLSRQNLVQAITLSRLSAENVAQLVRQMAGGGERVTSLARHLYRETEGNPFYLMETIQTLIETQVITIEGGQWQGDWTTGGLPLAPGIMAAIEARVQRLDSPAQEAVRLAAILGREFDFELLNALWGKGEEQTLAALDDLLRSRLIAEGTGAIGRDYAFTHHKIQEALYAALPGSRRWRTHARVARLMEAQYPPEEVASELGFHYQQGQQADNSLTPQAVAYWRLAGEQAASQFAHEEAIRYFSQALAMLPSSDTARIPLLLAREKALDNMGNRPAQAQDLTELAELVKQSSANAPETIQQQTAISLRRSNFGLVTGNYEAAIATTQTALPLVTTAEEQIELIYMWGLALFHQGEHETAITKVQQAVTLAKTAELPSLAAKGFNIMAMIAWRQGRYEEAKVWLQDVLAASRHPGSHDLHNEGNALGNLGIICRYQSDFASAESYFKQTLAIWQQIGYRRGEGLYLINLGVVSFDTANYAAAHHYFQQALDICREIGDRENEQTVLSNLSVHAIYVAEFAQARRLAEQSLAICREIGNRTWEGIAYTNLGVIAYELGHYDEAAQHYQQSLKIRQERGDQRGEGLVWRGLGEVAGHQQDLAIAQHYCEKAVALLHGIGDQAEEGLALNTLAKVVMDDGRYTQAQSHLEAALRLSREIKSPLLEGRVLANLAQVTIRQGMPEEALTQARQALAIAQRIGTPVLAGDAWYACGLALEKIGRLPEAAEAYEQAVSIRRSINQIHRLAEPLASLDRIR